MNHGGLTLQQRRLHAWQSLDMLPRYASVSFNISSRCSEGDVRRAVSEAIATYDILRTRFTLVPGLKTPAAEVLPRQMSSCLEWTTLAFDSSCWQGQAPQWTVYAQWQAGSVSAGGDHWLSLHMHALCVDLRSAEILCWFIEQFLNGNAIEAPELDYSLVADWQASLFEDEDEDSDAERQEAAKFWQQRFDELRPLSFPLSQFLPRKSVGHSAQHSFQFGLSSSLIEGLGALADGHQGVTVARLLESAWAVCLASCEGMGTLAVSTYARERSVEELQDCCGLLDVYLPKQVVIEETYDWLELARAMEANDRQAMQYSEFLAPGVPDGDALDAAYDYEGAGAVCRAAAFRFVDWSECSYSLVSVSEVEHAADWHSLHLSVQCSVIEQTVCFLRGDPTLISDQDLSQLANRWQALLQRWLANATASVASVRHALPKGEPSMQSVPLRAVPASVFESLSKHARQRPDAAAFRFNSHCLTYAELKRMMQSLQRVLAEKTETGQSVGVLLERSIDLLPCLLGVMGCGRVLVPLDSAWPMARIERIVQDSGCALVITDEENHAVTQQLPGVSLLASEAFSEAVAVDIGSAEPSSTPPESNHPAYIMYTSGTTGTPRGVCVSHGALNNYTVAMSDVLDVQPASDFGWISTYAADLGYTAVFPALSCGGCVHLIDAASAVDVIALNKYCRQFPLDILKIVPSHCLALVQAATEAGVAPEFLPRDALVLGGESPSATLLNGVFSSQQAPRRVLNHYGPTEATIGVMWAELTPEQPSGLTQVLANNAVYIVDSDMVPVECGVRGELAISGASLSNGYFGSPSSTADAFVDVTDNDGVSKRLYRTGDYAVQAADGRIHILGRCDDQMKIRGFRVEPAEIERVLINMVEVSEAVVTGHPAHPEQLVAYVVPPRGSVLSTVDLRAAVSARLPEYMVPQRLLSLEQLPLTRNGKVDRQRLPDPDDVLVREYQAPVSDSQRLMVSLWERALELPKVGIADNFFDIGGHSLLGIKLLSQVRTQFRTEVGPGAIAEYATPAELVEHLQSMESQPGMIEKIAAARLRLASMSEAERQALEERAAQGQSNNGGLSPAA